MKIASRYAVLFVLVLAGLLTASARSAGLNLELPDVDLSVGELARQGVMPDSEAGLQMVREMRKHLPVIDDPELSQYIQSLGDRLARRASPGSRLYFLLVNDPDVNAFATVAGVVVVNSGLVLYTDSESELAAVLAHEIAHVKQNHISRMIAQSKNHVLGTGAALLAGVAASGQSPEAANAIITSAIALQQHNQLSFSREMESEADRVGMRILSGAGFKASGMPHFMQKLDRLNDNPYAQLTKYLQSHPLSLERVSDTRGLAARLGNRGKDDPGFLYMREKVRALTAKGAMAQTPAQGDPRVKSYSTAMQLANRGQIDAALQKLAQIHPASAPVTLARSDLLIKQRHFRQAADLLEPLMRNEPGDESLLLSYCHALLGLGRVDEAWNRIRGVVPDEMTSLGFFETKQEIASAKGYVAEAYMAAAERNVRIGEYHYAIVQLRQASRLPGVSANDVARLQARLNVLENRYGGQ